MFEKLARLAIERFTRLQRLGIDTIKGPILIPFVSVVFFVVGAFVITALIFEERQHLQDMTESVQRIDVMFRQKISDDIDNLRGITEAVSGNVEIKAAFLRRDLRALESLALPVLERQFENSRISNFRFKGFDLNLVLNFQKRTGINGNPGKIIISTNGPSGVVPIGLEVDKSGVLNLWSIVPWYDGGRVIGYIEVSEGIDHIINEIHRILNVDILLVTYKDFVDRELWEMAMKAGRGNTDWNRFKTSVQVNQTKNIVPPALSDILAKKTQYPYDKVLKLKNRGRVQFASFVPVFDASWREVGNLVIVRDVTESQTTFRDFIVSIAAISIFAGFSVFILFFFLLGRVEREHARQRKIERQLAKLSTEHGRVVQMEKLSELGRTIGEIAHQINNPLVGVVNMAQLAEREPGNPEKTREMLSEILKAGEGCRLFVQHLLEFTKVSHSDRKSTEVKPLIEETIELFQQSLETPPQVNVEFPDSEVVLDVDPILIRHALFNLLTNAAQADKESGAITVRLSAQKRTTDLAMGWKISVQDQGPGIAEDEMDKILTPFYTTHPEGTGLGLPVVCHVAILHDGDVLVQNNPDGGADIALWLPEVMLSEIEILTDNTGNEL